jgi:hypothetical protein
VSEGYVKAKPRSIVSGEFKTLVALLDDVSEFLAVARGAAIVNDQAYLVVAFDVGGVASEP